MRAFDLERTVDKATGSTEYVPKMWSTKRGALAVMTGDLDGLYLLAARGTSLTMKQCLAESQILGEHALGGSAALEVASTAWPATYINLEQSLLLGPREFWLDVIGGFVAR